MVDWHEIKNDYITGAISFRQLAKKYNLNQSTVSRRAKKEDWETERETFRELLEKRKMEEQQELEEYAKEDILSVEQDIVFHLKNMLRVPSSEMSPTDLRRLTQIYKDLYELHFANREEIVQMEDKLTRVKELLSDVPSCIN